MAKIHFNGTFFFVANIYFGIRNRLVIISGLLCITLIKSLWIKYWSFWLAQIFLAKFTHERDFNAISLGVFVRFTSGFRIKMNCLIATKLLKHKEFFYWSTLIKTCETLNHISFVSIQWITTPSILIDSTSHAHKFTKMMLVKIQSYLLCDWRESVIRCMRNSSELWMFRSTNEVYIFGHISAIMSMWHQSLVGIVRFTPKKGLNNFFRS